MLFSHSSTESTLSAPSFFLIFKNTAFWLGQSYEGKIRGKMMKRWIIFVFLKEDTTSTDCRRREGIENRLVATESGDSICTVVDEALGICLFDKNAMQRNPSKYKAIVFGNLHSDPKSVCENPVIPLEDDKDSLGVTVDSKSLNSTSIR